MTPNLRRTKRFSEELRVRLHQFTSHSSYPQVLTRRKLPFEVSVQSSDVNSSWNVDALSEVIDVFEWALDPIKDGSHDPWTQLHREGFPCSENRVSDRHTSCGKNAKETPKQTFSQNCIPFP